MSTESTAPTGGDPMKAVADAMDAAVKAAQEGAEGARATVAEAFPAASQMVSRVVYKACYGLSYGIVFPTMFVARSIPKNNAAVHGFLDGAHAAMDMIDEMKPQIK